MSIFHNTALAGASGAAGGGAGGYQIERSLRFNSSDSAYLSRTPASAGNRKTWTWAGWVKRSAISSGSYMDLFTALTGASDFTEIRYHFNANDDALMLSHVVGGVGYYVYSSNIFRDPSSWYHIVVAVDTTQATSTNRVKIYVNGVQVTQNTSGGYPAQNSDTSINATAEHRHGSINTYGRYFSGYLADIHFIDGQALTPSDFTETDATTGQLIPKAYTGSYGTNGFHLPFSDNSTAAALGTDTSGAGNNWTVNNISVAAGSGNDSLVDTPTSGSQVDTGLGGQVTGNYCTLNPLAKGGDIQAPTNGNLQVTSSGSGYGLILGTIGMSSGKWYWEVTTTSANCATGIATNQANLASYGGADAYSWVWVSYSSGSNKRNNNSQSSYGSILASGDVVGIAFDADNGTLTFYKNNVSQGAAYTGLAGGTYLPVLGDETTAANIDLTANFGQRPFAYTAPSGFKALCDTNLPAPVVAQPSTVMDVVTYTGTGASRSITGLGFSPDFVWIKERGAAGGHNSYDTVRGASVYLASESTNAEGTDTDALTAFNSDGFSLGSGYTVKSANGSGRSYVAWTWDAGSSTVTNTDGSITSQVRANPSAGFSIVTYTGTSAIGATVGHGLGVLPSIVIIKCRNSVTDWHTYVRALDPNGRYQLYLNKTNGSTDFGSTFFAPNSSTVTLNSNSIGINLSGSTYVAYCFAPVAGYSAFGSYTGNGSTDGPFVYCGFRPRWIMYKSSSHAYYWVINDAARDSYNSSNKELFPNDSLAETVVPRDIDLLSNGFKLRNTGTTNNQSGATYIYAAFAENPFQYARAR